MHKIVYEKGSHANKKENKKGRLSGAGTISNIFEELKSDPQLISYTNSKYNKI